MYDLPASAVAVVDVTIRRRVLSFHETAVLNKHVGVEGCWEGGGSLLVRMPLFDALKLSAKHCL